MPAGGSPATITSGNSTTPTGNDPQTTALVPPPPGSDAAEASSVITGTTISHEVTTIDEDEEWGPSTEQILASTTKKAQPIRALERMRQVERTAMKRALQRAEQRKQGSRGGIGKGGKSLGYGGSGTLDVFAVLAQVNEQLSAAPDLQSFLDVVVGIMKDLTQFHRVLIYQFDEVANGQVSVLLLDSRFPT